MVNLFGTQLRSFREDQSLSLMQLAEKVDVSKQMIHKYENGERTPSTPTLIRISNALGKTPADFFNSQMPNVEIGDINFREEHKFPDSVGALNIIVRACEEIIKNVIEVNGLVKNKMEFSNPLQDVFVKDKKDIEKAAKLIRKKWKLGYSPIKDVVELVEDKGIIVVEIDDFSSDEFSGLSGFANEKIPFIVVNEDCGDVTRKRFTTLHELAHLLISFSDGIPISKKEFLCDHFAGIVLLVDDALIDEIGRNRTNISMEELVKIKEKYGISVQAIIFKTHQAGIIDYENYSSWWTKYKEWVDTHGNDCLGSYISKEKPRRLEKIVIQAIQEKLMNWHKATEVLRTSIDLLKPKLNHLTFSLE